MVRSYGKRRSGKGSSGPVDHAAFLVRHARDLVGEDGDPWAVSAALFKAGFDSLVRLAPSDDRRRVLMLRVGERAYEEVESGERDTQV